MSTTVGVRAPVGMDAVLANMGPGGANKLTKNADTTKWFQSMLGPESMGAAKRFKQTKAHVDKLLDFVGTIRRYGNKKGWGRGEQYAYYQEQMAEICGLDTAGGPGAEFGPFSEGADDFMSLSDQMHAKADMFDWLQANWDKPEFANEMAMAATVPIAKQMIPNTVVLKAFITDLCLGSVSKPYYAKKRANAARFGLGQEMSKLQIMEVMEYTPIIVTPVPYNRNVSVDMKWIELLDFDVPADILTDGGRELQVLWDSTFFSGLDTVIANGSTAPAANTTTNGYRIDNNGCVMTLEVGLNPAVEHINAANMILRNRGYRPDLILTTPYELGQLMSEQAVLMAYAFGTREVQETGLVGGLMGNAVAWSPNMWQGGAPSSYVSYVVDSDELARIVLGKPITVYPYVKQRQLEFELYARLEFLIRNSNAAVKIVMDNTTNGIT